MIGAVARKLFGSANERRIRTYAGRGSMPSTRLRRRSSSSPDEALRARTEEFTKSLPTARPST